MWLKEQAVGHRGLYEFALRVQRAEQRNEKLGTPGRGEWSVGEFFLDLADAGPDDEYWDIWDIDDAYVCGTDHAELGTAGIYDELDLIAEGDSITEWYDAWWTAYQHHGEAPLVRTVADYFEVTDVPDECRRPLLPIR